MRLSDLDYELPPELIAQTPAEPRDSSRLLVCRGCPGSRDSHGLDAPFLDATFRDLPHHLRPGDVLVRNDSRVLAARTFFRRPTGGRLEVLFLGEEPDDMDGGVWEVLMRGRPRVGERLSCASDPDWQVRVLDDLGEGRWRVRSEYKDGDAEVCSLLSANGEMPLPPYIRRRLDDPERYQTTYCRVEGSAAAPTAGLHFTPDLDEQLRSSGVQLENLTLHVGLGTFKPLSVERLDDVRLHAERFQIARQTWERIAAARAEGRRVVAVGTTVVRALEHLAASTDAAAPALAPALRLVSGHDGVHDSDLLSGSTRLLIGPGYRFLMVDGMITNFHLPRTSLLALVMAFCGVERTRALYSHAIAARYRFYSLGDAMLAL